MCTTVSFRPTATLVHRKFVVHVGDCTTRHQRVQGRHDMKYDDYLAQGYPIASGVIEGACRHLVKDRMERSGRRWKEDNAGALLFVRARKATDLWDDIQQHRQAEAQTRLHPHRHRLENYTPGLTLAA